MNEEKTVVSSESRRTEPGLVCMNKDRNPVYINEDQDGVYINEEEEDSALYETMAGAV